MATPAQIAANRMNALKSTGPKTEEGKSASSVNNRKHGFRGEFFLAPAESAEEWEQLKSEYTAEWQPATETERNLVQMLAENFWLRKRAQMKLVITEHQLETNFDGAVKLIEMLARYEAKYERAFHKCLKQLQDIRKQKEKEQVGFERSQAKERQKIGEEMLHDLKVRTAEARLRKIEMASNVRNTAHRPVAIPRTATVSEQI